MNSYIVRSLVAGVFILTIVSLSASVLKTGALTDQLPRLWLTVGDVLFGVSLIGSLVWSTALARALRQGWLTTAVLALVFGGGVVLATGLLVEATFRPLWEMLPFPALASIGYERDGIWVMKKAIQCLLLTLPFAAWRAVQNRPQSLPGPGSVTSTF